MVHFAKVVLPATVPLYPGTDDGDAAGLRGSGDGGGGGGATVVAGVEGELPLFPRESGDGDGGDGLPPKLSVVAHSMGGLVAVEAALEEPLLFGRVRYFT